MKSDEFDFIEKLAKLGSTYKVSKLRIEDDRIEMEFFSDRPLPDLSEYQESEKRFVSMPPEETEYDPDYLIKNPPKPLI